MPQQPLSSFSSSLMPQWGSSCNSIKMFHCQGWGYWQFRLHFNTNNSWRISAILVDGESSSSLYSPEYLLPEIGIYRRTDFPVNRKTSHLSFVLYPPSSSSFHSHLLSLPSRSIASLAVPIHWLWKDFLKQSHINPSSKRRNLFCPSQTEEIGIYQEVLVFPPHPLDTPTHWESI